MLIKLGLTKIVDQLVWGGFGIVKDMNAKRPDTFLGIRKERVKQLIKAKGDLALTKCHANGKAHGCDLDGYTDPAHGRGWTGS